MNLSTLTPHLARYSIGKKDRDFQTNRLPDAVARSMQSSVQFHHEKPKEINKIEKARLQREQVEYQNRKFKVFLALKPILF